MSNDDWIIRRAEEPDLDAVSVLAAKLVRFHHALDPERYLDRERVQEGYRWWLGKELGKRDVVITVAALGSRIAGYAYGRIEEPDWMRLLDAHGALHDVWVEDDVRGSGIAARLVGMCLDELVALGAPRLVLDTAYANERARRFFAKLGFRPTMVEMTAPPTAFARGRP